MSELKKPGKKKQGPAERDPLALLGVIDRLEVGPVQIEPQRLRAPYRVFHGGREDAMELIYKYEEEVFHPEAFESRNLAGMISAQVALNYGLFCDEISFHGPFDKHDRRFIRDMAANTACEIYVKKFLEPNPFITGPASELPRVKRESYLRARLTFPDGQEADGERRGPSQDGWAADDSRHAVLSSGGKDSLLSFGALRELGREVHPVFLNESGRHWFTALNAFRYFSANVPGTARVWTNADRVFNRMLNHLPFVRKDHAAVRSDEYPIRLWTVAVFLFGALPILKKRGVGRLIIGDEYDTTSRVSLDGITHYDGLYDQSRYFDDAMTAYFRSKEWGITQFSMLRSLSELLIEKILVERYPDLQRQQVSCHASHMDGLRVRPCGKCEKCRRIVGMLTALDADQTLCGYTRRQVEHCIADLAKRGANQEKEAGEHLAYMLQEKGLLQGAALGGFTPRRRPEIMKLRFDPERSPKECIPGDIREPLYQLFLEHAEGAVRRHGRGWTEHLPVPDSGAARGSRSSPERRRLQTQNSRPTGRKSDYLLGEMTWPEADEYFRAVDVALLPVGAIEQHGPHLPLDADAFDAEHLAREVARACKKPRPLVLPLISYGVSYHHEDFSGTISLDPETLSQVVYDVGISLARHGIIKLVIVNGHGGNSPALHFAAQMINRDAHIFTCVETGESSDPDIYAMTETPNDVHAGEIETSTTLATRPHLVALDRATKYVPEFSNRYLDFTSKRSVGWYAHVSKISPSGVLGDPTRGNREKGLQMWDLMIKNMVEFVEDLKGLSLEEIYQKRY